MLAFLKLQFKDLPLIFYAILFGVCLLVGGLSYWGDPSFFGIFVAILGILYAFFAGEGKLVCFGFGILYSILYAYLAFEIKLYGDVMLNLFYVPINILGILSWSKNQNQTQTKIMIRSLSASRVMLCLLCVCIVAAVYGAVLQSFGADFAFANASSVVLQLVAFYLQVRRYVQSYFLVTLANVISCVVWGMIAVQDLAFLPQALNMLVFLGIGVYYWKEWIAESCNEGK